MIRRFERWFTRLLEGLESWARDRIAQPASDSAADAGVLFRKVLSDITARWDADASGRFFPATSVIVRLASLDDAHTQALRKVFSKLESAVKHELESLECSISQGLRIRTDICAAAQLTRGVAYEIDWNAAIQREEPRRKWRLRDPNSKQIFELKHATTFIGRERHLTEHGGIVRENHISFTDPHVSMAHAHIKQDEQTGALILYQDNAYNYTVVLRDGDLPQRVSVTGRGFSLRAGDRIQLGKTPTLFTVEADDSGRTETAETFVPH